MAYTASQVNTLFQSILQRPADVAAIQAFAGSSASNEQIRTQIETSNEAAVNVNPIVRLYQGAFGRLPDTAGLQANVTNYTNGYNINATATAFLAGPEAAAIFGSANPTVTTSFVSTVYQNALNRTAGASETAYWVSTGKSAGQVLAEISNSQEAVNKEAVPTISFLDAQATSALNGTNTSVTGNLYNQVATNSTFTVGTTDAIVGSVNNDKFDTVTANIQSTDTIAAGAGVDTLNVTGTFATTNVPTTLTGLEVINVIGADGTGGALNLSTVNGLNLVTLRGDTTGGQTVSLKSGVLAGFDAVGTATTAVTAETVTFVGTSTFGSAALANGANIGTLTLNNAGTTVNLLSTGSAGNTGVNKIGILAATGDTTINVSGDKAITIGQIDTSVTKLDATNLTGANLTVTLGAQDIAVTGGSGNDKFIFTTTNLTTADTVVGGLGTDTVQVVGADYSTTVGATTGTLAALNTKVSGVEQLEFVGAPGGSGTIIDGNTFTNTAITNLLFNTTTADTINNAGSARLYSFGATNAGDATFALKSGTTAINLSLEGAAASGANPDTAGVAEIGILTVTAATDAAAGTTSTVSITSNLAAGAVSAGANTIGTFTAAAGSTLNLGGSQDITIGALTNGGTISGGAYNGVLTLTLGSGSNDVITLGTGGSNLTTDAGVDTVSVRGGTNVVALGAGNDIFTATAGTNTVTGGAGADSITLGSGADKLVYTVAGDSTAATPATTLDTVTNFTIGTDKFIVGTGGTAAAPLAIVQGSAFTAAGTGTLATDIGSALQAGGQGTAGATLAVGTAAVVSITGTDAGTYLVYNNATTGYASTDTVIKLAGLSGALALSDFATA